jgi:tetratricopeptide (TPR) repeat protein
MRKSINYLFLAIMITVIVVLSLSVHFLHSYQMTRNARAMLEQADREISAADAAKGDPAARDVRIAKFEKAKTSLEHYLRYEPDDVQARIKLAVLLDDLGQEKDNDLGLRTAALNNFKKVRPNIDDNLDLRRRQIDIAMAIGKFDDARTLLIRFLEQETNPRAAEDQYLAGQCAEAAKQVEEALKHYEESIKVGKKVESYARAAHLYQQLDPKQPDVAEQKINVMVEAHTESYKAYLERARYRLRHHASDKEALQAGFTDIESAKRLSAKDLDVLLTGADLLTLLDKKEEAGNWLRESVKHHPQNVRGYLALVSHEARDAKADAALAVIERALKETPAKDHNQLLHFQADLYISKNKLAEADDVINRLRAANYAPALMDYLQARIHMLRGEWSHAERLLMHIRQYLDDVPLMAKQADQMLGLCFENLGNPDQQRHYYESALKLDPKSLPARFGLAKSQLAMGQHDEAFKNFRELLANPDAPPATHVLMARALLLRNLRLPPDKRDWTELDAQLDQAAAKLPKASDVQILRAEVLLMKDIKNLEAARALLTKGRDDDPIQVDYWIALANLAAREKPDKTFARTFAILDEAEKLKVNDPVALTLARLRFLVRLPKLEAQQKLAKIELEKDGSSDRRTRLLAGLADAYYGIGERAEAIRLWNQLRAAQPNNLAVRLLLYDLATAAGKDDEMVALLKEIRDVEGEKGIYWRYGQAGRAIRLARPKGKEPLSEDGKAHLGTAAALLGQVKELRGAWYRIPALEAEILEIQGPDKIDQAIDKYKEALDQGDRRPWTVRKLVELLNNRGRYPEAGAVLKELAGNEADLISVGLGKAIVERMIIDKESQGALEIALQAVPPGSKDHRDHIWLGRVYQELKDLDKAKQAYLHAVELNPAAPESWVYLVRFLSATNQKEELAAAMTTAEQKLDPERKAFALAHLHETLGNLEKAEHFNLEALKSRATDPAMLQNVVMFYQRSNQLSKTEPHLRALLAQLDKTPDQAGAASWSRRSLAVVLALGNPGNHRKLLEAKTLLDANDKKPVQPVEDKRARALLLSTHIAYRAEAIDLHQQLPKLDPAERLRLAQLHDADGHWHKAVEHLNRVLSETRKDKGGLYYAALAYYARGLLAKDKKFAEVGQLVQSVDGEMAKAFFVKDLRARVLKGQGKDAEALQLLTDHAQSTPADRLLVAGLLDQLGHLKPAEAMYREHIKDKPAPLSHLALAEFLGRGQRTGEALKECAQALALGGSERAPGVAVAVVRASKSPKPFFAEADKLIEDCLAKSANPIPVLLARADLRDQQGKYDESIKAYVQILKHNAEHAVALNNLAWILTYSGGDKELALKHINLALELLGPLPELLDTRGTILLHMDRGRDAVADLQTAISLGASPIRYFHLAQAHLKTANREDAMEALRLATELGLRESQLHPLEQKSLGDLRKELESK